MFDFLKSKLTRQIEESAKAASRCEQARADFDKAAQGNEALEIEIEEIEIHRSAAERTHRRQSRLKILTEQLRMKMGELEAPKKAPADKLKAAENEVTKTTEPTIKWAVAWIRETKQIAPVNDAFSRLCLGAIHDIEALRLRPLGDVLKTIEKHAAAIQSFEFGERLERSLPALSIQALAW